MKLFFLYFAVLAAAGFCSGVNGAEADASPVAQTQTASGLQFGLSQLKPEVRQHLTVVLAEIFKTDTGKFLKEHISPELTFSTRPMVQLGTADTHKAITLESLRLTENTAFEKAGTPAEKVKICFTAEILSHELLHNAQMNSGLFQYPDGCSGYEAVLCEKLLELQAKYTGETMFQTIRRQDAYRSVSEKSRLLLVIQMQSQEPEKEFFATVWRDCSKSASGLRLYREQIVEIHQWNIAYAEQAFRNNYMRFVKGEKGADPAAYSAHLQKILDFQKVPLTAAWLIENTSVKPIENGIACFEDGIKVMEFVAVKDGYLRRIFKGSAVQETLVRIRMQ